MHACLHNLHVKLGTELELRTLPNMSPQKNCRAYKLENGENSILRAEETAGNSAVCTGFWLKIVPFKSRDHVIYCPCQDTYTLRENFYRVKAQIFIAHLIHFTYVFSRCICIWVYPPPRSVQKTFLSPQNASLGPLLVTGYFPYSPQG